MSLEWTPINFFVVFALPLLLPFFVFFFFQLTNMLNFYGNKEKSKGSKELFVTLLLWTNLHFPFQPTFSEVESTGTISNLTLTHYSIPAENRVP